MKRAISVAVTEELPAGVASTNSNVCAGAEATSYPFDISGFKASGNGWRTVECAIPNGLNMWLSM